MRQLSWMMLAALLVLALLPEMSLSTPVDVQAQDQDVGTPPVIITPGAPLGSQLGAEIEPTRTFEDGNCYQPLALRIGDVIYIEPGVNIRSAPDGSSAIVWNTAYNQVDEDGEPLEEEEQFSIEAFVVDGPVCTLGYNWWQIDLPGGIDGWVSEGRPVATGGYLISAPGVTFNETECNPQFGLVAGDIARLTQNVRVREEPTTDSRVRTVAPFESELQVLEGPLCNREGAWFRVQVEVVDFIYDGWMLQGRGGAVWLIPTDLPSEEAGTLCGVPLDFAVGETGYVDTPDSRPRFLRDGPGRDANVLYMLVDGVPFSITGTPVCRDNLNWWPIQVLSSNPVTGWIAEGSQGVGYWLDDINPNEFAR